MNEEQQDPLGLSGKFLVAGELLRHRIDAALTCEFGNKCNVIARYERMLLPIEVVTARDPKWSVEPPEQDESIYVLVYLPRTASDPNQFFILTGAELLAILKQENDAYLKQRKRISIPGFRNHGSITSDEIEQHRGEWDKIRRALARPRRSPVPDITLA